MIKHIDIPVEIVTKWLTATFEFVSTGDRRRACVVNVADRVMVVDEAFLIKNSNLPQEWIRPIIDKLKELVTK